MFSDLELQDYFEQHSAWNSAREYIRLTRDSNPARLVGTRASTNSCSLSASTKMQHGVQTESGNGEEIFRLECEYSDAVLEIWDQPQPVSVNRTIKGGRKRRGSYIADYLILTTNGPEIIEVKPEKVIQTKLINNPQDWTISDEGKICYLPGFKAFADLGLKHRLVSTKDLNPIRAQNIFLLLEAQIKNNLVTEGLRISIGRLFLDNSWITLSKIAERLKIIDLTPIFQLINEKALFFALDDELLSQPESTCVMPAIEFVQHYLALKSNDLTKEVFLNSNEPVDTTLVPTRTQMERALKNLSLLESGVNSRQTRRLKQKIKQGADRGLTTFQSLLPNWRGNNESQLNIIVTQFIDEFIEQYHATHRRLPPGKSYALYKNLATKEHPNYDPVSRPTYIRFTHLFNQQMIARGRGGRRAANAAAPPTEVQDRQFRATVPFQRASIDHHLIKLACILAKDGKNTVTAYPWMTAITDIATRVILAIWISFRPPSSRSCAMVIRQCVRKYQRLPAQIYSDRGPDFRSVYWNSFLLHCGITSGQRPPEHSRFGHEIESFFHLFESQWICMRPGNRRNFKESRAVSSSHSPHNNAVLTLEDLLTEAHAFVGWHNNTINGTDLLSPLEHFNNQHRQYKCVGREIKENREFIIASAVDVRKYKVNPQTGIHTDSDLHYWHPSLSNLAARKRPAEVRMEPEDPYRIYALVNGNWITCYSTEQQRFYTKDPIVRLAESVRVLDGKSARNQAKDLAEQGLVEILIDRDDQLSARNIKAFDDNNSLFPTQIPQQSVFENTKNVHPLPLPLSSWED